MQANPKNGKRMQTGVFHGYFTDFTDFSASLWTPSNLDKRN